MMYGSPAQAPTAAAAYGNYGAMPPQGDFPVQSYDAPLKSPFARGPRKAINLATIALCLLLPWLVFTAVYALLSFSVHYQQAETCWVLCGLLLLVVLAMGYFAYAVVRRRVEGNSEPAWYVFLFATSLLAWIAAVACGQQNFVSNMVPYFDVMQLNVYPSVDPARYRGQQLMDAGRIKFTPGSHVDVSRSMGFKNLDTYCVAPVTSGDPSAEHPLPSYDFWAVGLNCCSGLSADFHCGEYNNPQARSGLRLMRDDQRAYFRLAVQQAEAAHNIQASHPIFLQWMQDPTTEINAYQDDGYKYFQLGMFAFFAFQLFMVVIAIMTISKMGP